MAIRVVLADDHPVVLAGLEGLLETEGGFEVLACVRDGAATLAAVRQHHPDVLVLDLRMPNCDGLAVLREMKRDGIGTPVVVLTAADNENVFEAIRLGARGVVLKDMAAKLIVDAVRRVHAGGTWIERDAAGKALEKLVGHRGPTSPAIATLTARELQIARMTVQGLSNKMVADHLNITEGTAKLHLHHVYEKLNIDGRMALMRYLQKEDLD